MTTAAAAPTRTSPPAQHLPDLALDDGQRLYDALRGGRFVLLGDGAARLDRPAQVNAATVTLGGDRLVLVRPDAYVGWVGAPDGFGAWTRGYFGSPTAAARR